MRPIEPLTTDNATEISLDSLLELRRFVSLKSPPSRGQSSGQGRRALRARGMRFEEVRPYSPGDDVRVIDWRVTARTQKTHTKVYIDDNETHHVIGLDVSTSMNFATQGRFKSVLGAQLTALLGWSFVQHRDKVSLMLFNDSKLKLLDTVATAAGWTLHLKTLVEAHKNASVLDKDFNLQWVGAAPRLRQYTLITTPSAFLARFKLYQAFAMARPMHLVLLVDPFEANLPAVGFIPTMFDSMSSILMTSKSNQAAHTARFEALKKEITGWATAAKVPCTWCLTTDEPLGLYNQWIHAHGKRS